MLPDRRAASFDLRDMLDGYRSTCLMLAAAELGLFERLAGGAQTLAALAQALPAHKPSLQRLVRALEAHGLASQSADAVSLTPLGHEVVHEASAWRQRMHVIGAEYLPAWLGLAHSVRTGEAAFDHRFGTSAWAHRGADPALGASFDRIMSDDQAHTPGEWLDGYDFSAVGCVVDVGSGAGHLVRDILLRFAALRGIAFDRAAVIGRTRLLLEAAGLASRCAVVGGSFLESVPAGGDVYLLQHVLHDWHDDACQTILRNCHRAMAGSGRLLVIENLMPESGPVPAGLALLDLHMLAVLGGRERSAAEYRGMLARSGFEVLRIFAADARRSIIEARPTDA